MGASIRESQIRLLTPDQKEWRNALGLKHTASWPPTMAEAVFMLQNWHHWSLRNVTAGSSEITKPGKRQRQNLRQGTA